MSGLSLFQMLGPDNLFVTPSIERFHSGFFRKLRQVKNSKQGWEIHDNIIVAPDDNVFAILCAKMSQRDDDIEQLNPICQGLEARQVPIVRRFKCVLSVCNKTERGYVEN